MKRFAVISVMIPLVLVTASIWAQNKPATPEEQSHMLARLLGAVEDVGAGEHPPVDQKYIKEALGKLSGINKDINKRQYSTRLRWLAHHWYGRALLDSGDAKKALPLLEAAENEGNPSTTACNTSDSCVSDQERVKNAELLRRAREEVASVPN
jgi:hypothetical protein